MNRHLRELTEIGGSTFVAFCDIVVEKAETGCHAVRR